MPADPIVIVNYARTPMGGFQGALAGASATELGAAAVKSAVERSGVAPERIEQIMREGSGTQWDARIVDAFFACRKELYAVCQRGLGQSVYIAVERAVSGDNTKKPPSNRGLAEQSIVK